MGDGQRENPATLFIARTLAEHATGKPWRQIRQARRIKWAERASHLVIEMYAAGFTIPQPADPDAVWRAKLDAETADKATPRKRAPQKGGQRR
jgi:hypothetical protein